MPESPFSVRIVIFAVAAALLSTPALAQVSPQDSVRWGTPAMTFLAAMRAGDYTRALSLTSPEAPPGTFTAATLREAWEGVRNQAGPVSQYTLARVAAQGPYRLVDFDATFQRASLTLRVVMDTAARVTGLGFLPPQSPPALPPPPYADSSAITERSITFGHSDWRLGGTLTLPRTSSSPPPVVVLVHGSGPNDRDETVGPSKPFRDLAWGLAARGIAVFRYDKRTFAHPQRMAGIPVTLESEVLEDALAAIAELRGTTGVDSGRVFLLGHSLGGMLAPELARRDGRLAGVILAAAPARPFAVVLESQLRYLDSLSRTGDAAPAAPLRAALAQLDSLRQGRLADNALVMGVPVSYWKELDSLSSTATLAGLSTPALILQGGRDYQSTTEDFRLWESSLASRSGVVAHLFPALNHVFVAGAGMATPDEYRLRGGHVDESVVQQIASWIGTIR